MKITPEIRKLRDDIYTTTGMAVRESRIDMLANRVKERIEKLNLVNEKDYLRYLFVDRSGIELGELISSLVISETYFFREYDQLQLFAEELLLQTIKKKRARGDKHINLLSAGCATGEEPYTLAIILKEMLSDFQSWNILIDGVDINPYSLEKARSGVYTSHALREIPYLYRDHCFARTDSNTYQLNNDIKKMVRFTQVNLYKQAEVASLYRYDFVFCRNVMIYFDHISAARALENLYEVMKPEAFVFLGSAESVSRISNLFNMVRCGKNFLYQK